MSINSAMLAGAAGMRANASALATWNVARIALWRAVRWASSQACISAGLAVIMERSRSQMNLMRFTFQKMKG